MIRRPPRSTRTDTLFPYTTLFRSLVSSSSQAFAKRTEVTMKFHDFQQAHSESVVALRALSQSVAAKGMDKVLLELVKIRASQVNGCAYCAKFHINLARKTGRLEERRVRNACVRTCNSRLSPYTEQKTNRTQEHN